MTAEIVNFSIAIVAIITGFGLAFGMGANDAANAVGPSVGAGALSMREAILLAAIFEGLGAAAGGHHVTHTLRHGFFLDGIFPDQSMIFTLGMLATISASAIWLVTASLLSMPVSATHSVVGALIGFGLASIGISALQWHVIVSIFGAWLVTPAIAGVLAMFIYKALIRILHHNRDPATIINWIALLALTSVSVVGLTIFFLHRDFISFAHSDFVWIIVFAAIAALGFAAHMHFHASSFFTLKNNLFPPVKRERVLKRLNIMSAMAMAFGHGANDVANTIAPLGAILDQYAITVSYDLDVTTFITIGIGAIGIVTGLATFGYRVITTLGHKITRMSPASAMAAQTATSLTILAATGLGLPVSTTQTLVGAIIGIGLVKHVRGVNLKVTRQIVLSWLVTLPVSGLIAATLFVILRFIMHDQPGVDLSL